MSAGGYERIGSVSSELDTNNNTFLQSNAPGSPPLQKYKTLPQGFVQSGQEPKAHKKKIYAIVFLFLLSLFSFVSQTELTSYLYNGLEFNQTYLLLYLTHGSWTLIWPIQVFSIAIYKHFKKSRKHDLNPFSFHVFKKHVYDSLKNQHRNIFKTSGITIDEHYINDIDYPQTITQFITSTSIVSIFKKIVLLTVILNLAGCTWYFAMAVSPASDVTAIYNCSAFSALVLAIPILKEKFTYLKLSSVLIALFGVFCVSYSSDSNTTEDHPNEFPYRIIGDVVIGFGALLYGLYEVLYKKLVCPPEDSVSSKRQVAFSNFCASLLGIATLLIVWILIVFVHVFNISRFDVSSITAYSWFIIVLSIISNLVFSLSFLALMSLTSPVLSAVSSLVTILFVGLFEWLLFGVELAFQQLLGDIFIVVGFGVLSYSYWNEINKEDVEDEDPTDMEDNSVYNR